MDRAKREEIIERIRKLRAHNLGDGTTADEADTARLMAKKLMVMHRLSMDDVIRGEGTAQEREPEFSTTNAKPEDPHAPRWQERAQAQHASASGASPAEAASPQSPGAGSASSANSWNWPRVIGFLCILLVIGECLERAGDAAQQEPPTNGANIQKKAPDDSEKFQGTWIVIAAEQGGEPLGTTGGNDWWVVHNDKVQIYLSGAQTREYHFVLNHSRGAIDLVGTVADDGVWVRAAFAGCYKFAPGGDRLLVCIAKFGGERPQDFFSTRGNGNLLISLQRRTPAARSEGTPSETLTPSGSRTPAARSEGTPSETLTPSGSRTPAARSEDATTFKGWLVLIVVGVLVAVVYTRAGEQQQEVNRRIEEQQREEAERKQKAEAERKRAAEEWERSRQAQLELEAREKWRIHHQYRTMRDIDGMSGLEFEQFLASLFAKLGYTEIQLTPVNDQGGDIVCKSPSGVKTVIQAKRWTKPLGNKVVQEVLGAMLH
jgi:uncharacterized protein (TIGR03067 family)